MFPTLESLGLDRLPVDERLALAKQLWQSVEAELDLAPLTKEQEEELDRRIADAQAHTEKGVPWETVLQQARARWGR